MKKIGAIGFDWGGVILQGIDGSLADAAAEFLQVGNQDFRHAYFLHNHLINKGAESKPIDQAVEMWSRILFELGKTDRLEAFMAFVQSRPKGEVSQAMVELLKKLKIAGWKLGLLSNASAEGARRVKTQEGIKLFDIALFSADIDTMKPEPEAFKKFASALGVPMSELVFIDDSTHSLSTAQEVGYLPILFKDTATLIEQLRSLGITV